MITANFTICFDFLVDTARVSIPLEADVQEHHSETFFIVRNFRIPGHSNHQILPEITIRQRKGQWVHTDSGKATDLSMAIGKAIEARTAT